MLQVVTRQHDKAFVYELNFFMQKKHLKIIVFLTGISHCFNRCWLFFCYKNTIDIDSDGKL